MKGDGFLADFLKLCSETAEDPIALEHLVGQVQQELLTKVSSRYLRSDLKIRGGTGDGSEWANLLSNASTLVAKTFADPK
jgi:hypothetical protein